MTARVRIPKITLNKGTTGESQSSETHSGHKQRQSSKLDEAERLQNPKRSSQSESKPARTPECEFLNRS